MPSSESYLPPTAFNSNPAPSPALANSASTAAADPGQGSAAGNSASALSDADDASGRFHNAHAADAIPGEYVVVLQEGADALEVVRTHGLNHRFQFGHALNGFSGPIPPGRLHTLLQDPRVLFVEPDIKVSAFSQTIPTGVQRIGATHCAVAKIDGLDERVNADVAILDTGIDLTHPDLNVYQHVSFTTDSLDGNDGHGHGTHVAGTVGALDNDIGVVGVAPGVRLWAVKVLDNSGSGSVSTIIKGVDYITAHANEIEVANMSLGGQGSSDSLRLSIQKSVAQGVVYVVAAGNSDFDIFGSDGVMGTSDDFFPAAYPEVMTVSALADSDGKPGGLGTASVYGADDTLAAFSNFSTKADPSNPVTSPGGAIDLAAPGVSIYSTYKGGGYATMSGTSMASPHVAGAVALYIAQNGRAADAAGVYAIRQALINSAEAQSSWGVNPTNPNHLDTNPEGLVNVADIGSSAPANTAPVLAISSPVSGASLGVGLPIQFTGSSSDTQDGDLSGSIIWTSNLDGPLGTGASFTATLSVGVHTLTAKVVDSGGLAASASITVTVRSNTPPVVLISSPANGANVVSGNSVPLIGSASDNEDGSLSSKIVWSSSLTGQIGTGASLSASLAAGTHVITATVMDSAGATSSAAVALTVTIPNTPPSLSINSPSNGAQALSGTLLQFAATATDAQDGDLGPGILWSSNLAGPIGTGASFTASLVAGTHIVSAVATDSSGASSTAFVSVTITNPVTPPNIAITSPAAGVSALAAGAIAFAGSAIDAQDGNISAKLVWTSNLSGQIGVGASFTATLVAGTHVIKAAATDSLGASAAAAVTVTVTAPAPNTPPTVTIGSPVNGSVLSQTTGITLSGKALDLENGDLSSRIVWSSSLDGALGTGASIVVSLSPGTHSITASATDLAGATSKATVSVVVSTPSLSALAATDATSYGQRDTVTMTVAVTSKSGAMMNVPVSFSLKTASGRVISFQATTDASGKALVQYALNGKRDGFGVYTLSASAALTGYLPAKATTTFSVHK